jgi:hypothetical protein
LNYNGVITVASVQCGGCASEQSAIYPLCCCGALVHGALLNKETEATKEVLADTDLHAKVYSKSANVAMFSGYFSEQMKTLIHN